PVAELPRQRLRARGVALAGGVRDGGVRTHGHGEVLFHLVRTCVAPPDAHALTGWRRVDIESGLGRDLRHRIDVGRVYPVRAAVVGDAEYRRVGDAAAAHLGSRLDD